MNFYPHFIGDYDRDTKGLTLIEHGAYRRLIDHCYATEEMPPNEIKECYRIAGAMTPAEQRAVDKVVSKFFAVNGNGLRHHKRVEEEIIRARSKSEKAKASAAASVKARFGDRAPVSPARAERDTEWAALVAACGSKCVRCGATDRPLERDHIVPTYKGGADEIANWQPICQPCNASKGPETIDHRPPDWRSAFAERTLNGRRASQNQNRSNSTTSDASHRKPTATPQGLPACPHQKLIALYHEVLPLCPKVVEWNGTRQALMQARWREQSVANGTRPGYKTEAEGLAFWRDIYFAHVAKSQFLTGRSNPSAGRKPFVADLEWLIRPTNFAKVVEGKYH